MGPLPCLCRRDPAYWGACFEVLSDFWWAHLVPAKHALASGNRALAEQYRCGAAACHTCWCVWTAVHFPECPVQTCTHERTALRLAHYAVPCCVYTWPS